MSHTSGGPGHAGEVKNMANTMQQFDIFIFCDLSYRIEMIVGIGSWPRNKNMGMAMKVNRINVIYGTIWMFSKIVVPPNHPF